MSRSHNYCAICCAAAAACIAFLAWPGSVRAEDSAAAAREAIEELVVTARRRDERLIDVPTAITAFGSDAISRFNLNTVDELANFTPGLMVAESAVSSGGSLSLRGVGSDGSNYLGDQSVSINVDGMQVGTLNVRKTAQIDLAQIEVLRGPQALFFGKNSPGGVIAFKTADPTDQREVELTVDLESESEDVYYQALYSGPISDNAGVRLVARFSDLNGYFNLRSVPANGDPYIVPGQVSRWPVGEEYFVRGTVVATPTDRFHAKGKVSYNKSNLDGGSMTAFQRIDCPFGLPQRQPDFPCKASDDTYLGGAPADAVLLVKGAPTAKGLGIRDNEQWLTTLEASYDISPELTLTSLTGYYDFSEMNAHNGSVGPRANVLVPYLPFDQKQWTQEVRLTSERTSPLNFMIGVFYETKETESSQDGVITFVPPAPFAVGTETAKEDQSAFSGFVQLTWDVNDRLEVSGGLRYSNEQKNLDFFARGSDVTSNLAQHALNFDNTSSELTVSYHLNDEVMVFASYKEGFKSGGFDGGFTSGAVLIPGFKNYYDEETVNGIETGVKANLGNRLVLNVIAYNYDYEDLQISAFDADTITFKVRNAAGASVKGIEADINWMTPLKGVSILGSLAYNDASFDKFLSPCYVGQTPAGGCNLTPNPITGAFLEQDLSGRELNNAPEFTGSAGVQYFHTFTNGLSLDLALNAFYSDDYIASATYSPQDIQDDYVKLNASVRLLGPNDQWEAALIGRNLTDEYTFSRSGPITGTGGGTGTDSAVLGDRSAVVSRGREVFFRLTYRPRIAR